MRPHYAGSDYNRAVSLYYVQKFLYQLNRDPAAQRRFREDLEGLLAEYDLSEDERNAIRARDVGLLYVLGVNGQILMHYAALIGLEWTQYLEAMREGVRRHGPVRAGLYAMTTSEPQA
jgi:hypothetical protein